jgi:YVTN family beta-propeller protein
MNASAVGTARAERERMFTVHGLSTESNIKERGAFLHLQGEYMNARNTMALPRGDSADNKKSKGVNSTRARGAEFIAVIISLIVTSLAHAEPFAYVTNQSSNSVSVIDTATNTVADSIVVGSLPWGVAITPDGAFAYVTNTGSANVSVIDTVTNAVTTSLCVRGQ